jgi:aminoglycoside 3-N-acetyltransferase
MPEKENVTEADIARGLAEVGMSPGDTVFVHSSLRSFGHVAGGAGAVIEALLQAVGPEGTVVVPTFTWDSFHDKTDAVFDMAKTPSETGRITEVFRQRSDALRSSHLCHSVAAIGRHAAAVTRDSTSVYGPGGPFETLLKLNAWNLFLGVTFTSCTALHMAEELRRVPYRAFRDYKGCRVVHPDGTVTASDSVEYLRKPGFWNDFGPMEAVFEAAGVLRQTRIGAARVLNIRIRDVVEIALQRLEQDVNCLLAADSGRVSYS